MDQSFDTPMRLLVLDDDEADFRQLRDLLAATNIPHELDWSQDCSEGLDRGRLLHRALERTLRHVMRHARVIRDLEDSRESLRRSQTERERLKQALDRHAIVSIADAAGTFPASTTGSARSAAAAART